MIHSKRFVIKITCPFFEKKNGQTISGLYFLFLIEMFVMKNDNKNKIPQKSHFFIKKIRFKIFLE